LKHVAFWRLALVLCGLAAWILLPISLASTWLAKRARAGEQRADMELLCAQARRRIREQQAMRTQR
jgi:hypothetical protein